MEQDTRELEGMLPQESTPIVEPISSEYTPDLSTYQPPKADIKEQPEEWTSQDIFNMYNPYFGVTYNTGLNEADSYEQTWDPEDSSWVSNLSLDDKIAVSKANSEEYAMQIMERRALYKESESRILADKSWTPTIAGFGASMVDPTVVIPIGVTAAATKSAYTLGAKATRLAALSAESAAVSMASVSLAVAAEKGQGLNGQDYGMANMYAGLIGGGLPVIGNMLGGGYRTASVASGLTNDPKNFIALTGELTAEKLGGTQLRTMYNKLMPDVFQSDVTFTASSDNQYVTLISNRIDSPPMAVVDRNTGKPIPIPTTGQDYKLKFNGRRNATMSDVRGLYKESTYTNEGLFNTEVGKTVRARAVKQENAVYEELEDHIAFTKSEMKLKAKDERVDALADTWQMKDAEGNWVPATDEMLQSGRLVEGETLKPKKKTKKEIKEYDKSVEGKIDEEIALAVDTKRQELYDAHQFEFEHHDPKVREAATRTDTYYKEVLEEGNRLKIAELKDIKANRHYMTRIFDFQKIREIDNVNLTNKIVNALKGHIANKGATADELLKAAQDIAVQLKKLDYTRDWADYSFFVPKELGTTSFLKHKKFKLNDSMIDDLLVTDIDDVMGQYSYAQAGHFSANNAFPELQGIPRTEQLDKFKELFIDPLAQSGAKAKEVQGLQNMFEDMLGTFRMAKDSNSAVWKGTRIANSINSLTYGGGFVLNTAAEIGGLLLDGHVSNVMKTRLGSIKEIGHMFNGKTIEDPLVRDFVLMGQMENLFETNSMMKMSDTDTVFNVGKVEDNLNTANSEFFKFTGLRGATVALEAMTGPKIIHDLIDFGKKGTISLSQEKYLARIGLTHKDAIAISKHLDKVGTFTKSGKIYDLNLDKWDDALLDKITTGVGRGIRHTVIKGDSTYLPSWMIKPNAFNRLVFQFLRYPMAATETLMARGMDESPARWMAATGTSTFMMAMVMYGREQAALATGAMEEREAKFNNFWEDDEAAMNLFTVSLAKAGTLGGSSIFVDRLSALSGVPTPGSEYATNDVLGALMGPTFSRLPQLQNILQPLLVDGEISNKSQWYAMKGLMPGATIPIISEWLTTQIKENAY